MVLAYNCFLRIQVYTYYDPALDAPPELWRQARHAENFPRVDA